MTTFFYYKDIKFFWLKLAIIHPENEIDYWNLNRFGMLLVNGMDFIKTETMAIDENTLLFLRDQEVNIFEFNVQYKNESTPIKIQVHIEPYLVLKQDPTVYKDTSGIISLKEKIKHKMKELFNHYFVTTFSLKEAN